MNVKQLHAKLTALLQKDAETPVYLGGAVPRELALVSPRSLKGQRILQLDVVLEPLLETTPASQPAAASAAPPAKTEAAPEPLLEVEKTDQGQAEGSSASWRKRGR